MSSRCFLLLCVLAVLGRAAPTHETDRLVKYLTGVFTSTEQALGDRNFRNATLHIAPIWVERTDGPWLYAEQALTEGLEHPYRQNVYQVITREDGSVGYRVYEPKDILSVTMAWQDPVRFVKLGLQDLIPREDCTVYLHEQPDGSFKGGTEGRGCVSSLHETDHATSEITISSNLIVIWDRGYNANGAQVTGSIHGGYRFKRSE